MAENEQVTPPMIDYIYLEIKQIERLIIEQTISI
jgi:hypothetical protein